MLVTMEFLNRWTWSAPGWATAIHKIMFLFILLSRLSERSLAQNFELTSGPTTYCQAKVLFKYSDPRTGSPSNITLEKNSARSNEDYAGNAKGFIRVPSNHGCSDYAKFTKESWVALMKRSGGRCKESEKIRRAQLANASAVILYTTDKDSPTEVDIQKDIKHIPVVLIVGNDVEPVLRLLDNGTKVYVEIEKGSKVVETIKVQQSSVLFVSVSFIVLMIISLAWLVFYYIQRFRYAQARDRTQRRLSKAAKKALLKLPVRPVKEDDAETKNNICPVCLELYKLGESIRVLPCSHLYHKACVDQWLIDHRTCPMCKCNILKALGYQTLPPQLSEEALYALELSQLMFGSGLDDELTTDVDYRYNEVETVRIPLNNQIALPRGNIVQIVMVPTPDGSESHENDFRDRASSRSQEERDRESRNEDTIQENTNGAGSNTTTTVELHRGRQSSDPAEQNPLIPHTSV